MVDDQLKSLTYFCFYESFHWDGGVDETPIPCHGWGPIEKLSEPEEDTLSSYAVIVGRFTFLFSFYTL